MELRTATDRWKCVPTTTNVQVLVRGPLAVPSHVGTGRGVGEGRWSGEGAISWTVEPSYILKVLKEPLGVSHLPFSFLAKRPMRRTKQVPITLVGNLGEEPRGIPNICRT